MCLPFNPTLHATPVFLISRGCGFKTALEGGLVGGILLQDSHLQIKLVPGKWWGEDDKDVKGGYKYLKLLGA